MDAVADLLLSKPRTFQMPITGTFIGRESFEEVVVIGTYTVSTIARPTPRQHYWETILYKDSGFGPNQIELSGCYWVPDSAEVIRLLSEGHFRCHHDS